MGTISVNKLAGLSIMIGPVLALVCYLVQPGGIFIDSADPADAKAVIGAVMGNSALSVITSLLIPIGIIMILYGIIHITGSIRDQGNGDALARYVGPLVLIGTAGWVLVSGLNIVIANDAGQAAGAVYAVATGLTSMAALSFALGFLLFGLALSTRDEFNKIFAYVVVIASIVSLVASLIGGADTSQLQAMTAVSGVCYVVWTLWGITLGLNLLNKD